MYQLMGNVWTYIEGQEEPKKVSVSDIRRGKEKEHHVKTFSELTSKVAKLAFLNPQWFLLFRGQSDDYPTRGGLTSLYPSIYRCAPDQNLLTKKLDKKFENLTAIAKQLREGYSTHLCDNKKEMYRLRQHEELCWALIQHYEIVATPYLDVTSSLTVAASFALRKSTSGFVYVLAMPYPTGSISHFVDNDIKIVRLQAACPPSAKRPHFQEGYLIGSCYTQDHSQHGKENVSRRLLSKFFIEDKKSFWNEGFALIPDKVLLPKNDIDLKWLKI